MLIFAAGDLLSLHCFGKIHSYEAYCSYAVHAVVLRHMSGNAKLVSLEGFSFWSDLTSVNSQCLHVRNTTLSACTAIHLQIIVHSASRSLNFHCSLSVNQLLLFLDFRSVIFCNFHYWTSRFTFRNRDVTTQRVKNVTPQTRPDTSLALQLTTSSHRQ